MTVCCRPVRVTYQLRCHTLIFSSETCIACSYFSDSNKALIPFHGIAMFLNCGRFCFRGGQEKIDQSSKNDTFLCCGCSI